MPSVRAKWACSTLRFTPIEALNDNPELINSSPYDDGWFFKIKPQNNDELEDLLDAEAYAQVSES